MSRNNIYYLLDFHKKCEDIAKHGDEIIDKYCKYVNMLLNKYFSEDQQRQFCYKDVYSFAYEDVYGISFDNIGPQLLSEFFDKVSFVDM
jgi:hypothetical protein